MKDILLIMSDQYGWAYMQTKNGRTRTPYMMGIAEEGLSSFHCYCNAPLCVPSRMSFLSGKMPGELQAFNDDTTLPIDIPTIAHVMGIRGYHTVLAGRMHFKGDDQNHGFDERLVGDITSQYWGTSGRQRTGFGAYTGTGNWEHCPEAIGGGYSPMMAYDGVVFQTTIECLEKGHEESLFLAVGSYGPYFPFTCESSLYRHYKGLSGEEELMALGRKDEYLEYRQTSTVEKTRDCEAACYGQMEMLDGYVGRLYNKFRQGSRKQLFIYVSDHGEQLGEHGIFGKQTPYQESARVLPLMAGTGMGPGARHGQVSLLSMSKTILAEAGANGSWHRGTAISLDKGEEPRPSIVIQQILGPGGGNAALAEAVTRVPFEAVKIGDAVRVYRLGENSEEELYTLKEGQGFLTEAMVCFISGDIVRKYIRQELELRKQHDVLKQWGKVKKPPRPVRIPTPECTREMPME